VSSDPFNLEELIFEKIAGGARVYDLEGNLLLYAEREGMSKLGKCIHVYPSKYIKREILTIKPLQKSLKEVIDLRMPVGLSFEVVESSGKSLGIISQTSVWERKLTKIVIDKWLIKVNDEVITKIEEVSLVRHLIRSYFFPCKYQIVSNGEIIGYFEQLRKFINFRYHMKINIPKVNTKLLVAWGILYSILSVRF